MAVAEVGESRAVEGSCSYRLTARNVSSGSTALRSAWCIRAAYGQDRSFVTDCFSVLPLTTTESR